MKFLTPWLLIVPFILACSKDETITPQCNEGDCLPFEIQDYNICFPGEVTTEPCDYYAVSDTVNYWGPIFNPTNSDEIGFMFNKKIINNGVVSNTFCQKFELYNHRTNIKVMDIEFPADLVPTSQPFWSNNNLLIFSTNDNSEVYTLDIYSSEFSYILNGSGPLWSPVIDNFLYTNGPSFGNATPYIANIDGSVVDTLSEFHPLLIISDWSDSGKILYDWGYWDFANQEKSPDFLLGGQLNIIWKKWGATDNYVVIIDNDAGLGIFNISMGNFNLLKPNCSGKYYGQVAVSHDKKYIATVVNKWTMLNEDSLLISPQIRVMNMDGSDEKILDIEP